MKKNKNLTLLGIVAIALIGFGYWFYSKRTNSEINNPVIGANLPLTGKVAFYGNEIKDAITLLKEQGKLNFVEFSFEDNQSTPQNAISIMNKFIVNKNIPIIISSNSPLTVPLAPLAEKGHKNLIGMVNGAKDFGLSNKWCFRDAITPEQTGKGLASYTIEKMKFKQGVSFTINDDYGLGVGDWFKKDIEKLGGKISQQLSFTKDDVDFRTNILKLLSSKPEFILIVGREKSLIGIINQLRERNKEILILTTDAFESESVQNGVNSLENLVFSSYANNINSEEYKNFESGFIKRFGRKPSVYAIDGFSTSLYINELCKNNQNNSEKIQNALKNLKLISPIKGEIYTNKNQEIISPVGVFKLNVNKQKEILFNVK